MIEFALKFATAVNEDSSCKLLATLKNYDGDGIGVAGITTATLTIKDSLTREVMTQSAGSSPLAIEDLDVRTEFDSDGLWTHYLEGESNPIVSDNPKMKQEVHIAQLNIVATDGSHTVKLTENIIIFVNNKKFKGNG